MLLYDLLYLKCRGLMTYSGQVFGAASGHTTLEELHSAKLCHMRAGPQKVQRETTVRNYDNDGFARVRGTPATTTTRKSCDPQQRRS